jgi:hypothetical protein
VFFFCRSSRKAGIARMADTPARPPLRARLHWYRLSPAEFALLTAMCEHCSDGSSVWAAIPRLAAYSKLSERNVQRLMRGLCSRGILSQLANGKHKPGTYRINEPALDVDPRMAPYRTCQQQPPGVRRVPMPHEPVFEPTTVTAGHPTGDTMSPLPVTPCRATDDKASPDPRASYSNAIDPTAVIRERALIWAEKNSYAYRAFCRELQAIFGAMIGTHDPDNRGAVLHAACRAGVPEHIALALTRGDS